MTSYYGVYGRSPESTVGYRGCRSYHIYGFRLGTDADSGWHPAVLTSPIGFLQRPARWIQMLASNALRLHRAELRIRSLSAKTKDGDMEGLDLGGVHGIATAANGCSR